MTDPRLKTRVFVETGKDCFEACLATLTGRRLHEIPKFPDDETWLEHAQRWAYEEGLILTDFMKGEFSHISILDDPGGGRHSHGVIAQDGERLHDPSENWPDFNAAEWPEVGRFYLFPLPAYTEKFMDTIRALGNQVDRLERENRGLKERLKHD